VHRRAAAKGGGLRLVISADSSVVRTPDLTGVGMRGASRVQRYRRVGRLGLARRAVWWDLFEASPAFS
jgi:hypothetical protein